MGKRSYYRGPVARREWFKYLAMHPPEPEEANCEECWFWENGECYYKELFPDMVVGRPDCHWFLSGKRD